MTDGTKSNPEFVGRSSPGEAPAADISPLNPAAAGATIPEAGMCGCSFDFASYDRLIKPYLDKIDIPVWGEE